MPAGTKLAIHAFRETLEKLLWDPGRVNIFVLARNAFNAIDLQLMLDGAIIHSLVIARYVHMVYCCALYLVYGGSLTQLQQGTKQGDPLGMFLFSLVLQPLIHELLTKFKPYLNIWCAKDGTLV